MSYCKKYFKILILGFASLFIAYCTIITLIGSSNKIKESDLIVVMGSAFYSDLKPTKILKRRLDQALDLYNNGYGRKIFLAGGFSYKGFYEGDIMRDYLVKKGVSEEDVIIENNAINTIISIAKIQNYLEKESIKQSVIIVSTFTHIPRIKYTISKLGLPSDEIYYKSTGFYLNTKILYNYVREFFALSLYFFKI